MLTAKDLMATDIVSVDPDDSVEEAIRLILKHGLSGLPVVDASARLLGYVSEFDLLDLVWDPSAVRSAVYRYMTREPHKVDVRDDVASVAEVFRTVSVRHLPVMRDDRLVGIISRGDLLTYVLGIRKATATAPSPLPLAARDDLTEEEGLGLGDLGLVRSL